MATLSSTKDSDLGELQVQSELPAGRSWQRSVEIASEKLDIIARRYEGPDGPSTEAMTYFQTSAALKGLYDAVAYLEAGHPQGQISLTLAGYNVFSALQAMKEGWGDDLESHHFHLDQRGNDHHHWPNNSIRYKTYQLALDIKSLIDEIAIQPDQYDFATAKVEVETMASEAKAIYRDSNGDS